MLHVALYQEMRIFEFCHCLRKNFPGTSQSSRDNYRLTPNISRTLVGDEIVENSDVVRAPPVGAAPTTSSFST